STHQLGLKYGFGSHRMPDLVPVSIIRELKFLRMPRIVLEKARIKVNDLVAKRLGLTIKSRPHEVEVGLLSRRERLWIAKAVNGEQDALGRQTNEYRQVVKERIDRRK